MGDLQRAGGHEREWLGDLSHHRAFIQKTVNWFAAAIHTADPNALVTNGSQTFDYCSGVSGKNNYTRTVR